MKQKILSLAPALLMMLAFTGCAQTPPSQPSDAPSAEVTSPVIETEPAGTPEAGIDLTILYEQDDSMINTYSLLAVDEAAPFTGADGDPVSDVAINTVGAKALIDWMLSEEGTALIRDYGYADYGEYLFYLKDDRPASSAENYGYTVEVTSAGTGKAIAAAQYGNADLILVHSKSQEEAFVEAGFAKVLEGYDAARLSFMYNYFVLVGPAKDPAGCAQAATVRDAFRLISEGKYPFVSRGDKSGTHTKELSLWPEELGITDEADSAADHTGWYVYSNAGMGVCLTMAEEMDGYILSDKATFLTFRASNGQMD